jgi:gliding motility-associated-like protein
MKKMKTYVYCFTILFLATISNSKAVTYTVTSTGDGPAPGTLRNAITSANGSIGLDIIQFNITGVAPYTITLGSYLPDITDPVYIDGYSQSGTSFASGTTPANLAIIIKGYPGFGSDNDAFRLVGVSGCTIRGFVFNRCNNGVALLGATCFNNTVSGNYFGLDYTGDGTAWVYASHTCNNAITIGTGAYNNTIGGLTDAERNIISGNTFGISVGGQGPGNKIIGNFIGVDAFSASNASFYNATGILISSSTAPLLIGGTAPGSRNIISGNYNAGIFINTSDSITIQGNYIGTDYTGFISCPNAISNLNGAVQIGNGSHNMIGGTTAAARNIISGNTVGYGAVFLGGQSSDTNYVFGNYIGLAPDGITPVPNRYGVYLDGGSTGSVSDNYIGSPDGSGENIIAYNNTEGIILVHNTTFRNRIFWNQIYCNAGNGIILTNSGNGFKAAPIITGSSDNGLSGTAAPGDTIELFYADTVLCSGVSGRTHFDYAVANSSGFWKYHNPLTLYSTFVAIATSSTGNSSLFSNPVFILPCSVSSSSAGSDITNACVDSSITLSATAPPVATGLQGKWITSGPVIFSNIYSASAIAIVAQQGNYQLVWKVSDTLSYCSASDTMNLTAAECNPPATGEISVFNAISPNGDGHNDVFIVKGIESFPDNELKIFDREGNVIYSQDKYKNDWSGVNKKGDPIPDGTYYFLFDFKDLENKDDHKKGFIVVKR